MACTLFPTIISNHHATVIRTCSVCHASKSFLVLDRHIALQQWACSPMCVDFHFCPLPNATSFCSLFSDWLQCPAWSMTYKWSGLHQGNPCYVFSSFQLSSALICKHGRNRQPRNNTVFGFIRNPVLWIYCWVCLTTVLWFCQPGVPKCSVSFWFLIFQSLVDRFLLFPVMGYWRRLSYLQLYCDRSTPGQVWQVSSWQGWMEHLISTCCTAKSAHQQLGVISYSHLSVSMVDLKTGLILHTHICMNKSGFTIL